MFSYQNDKLDADNCLIYLKTFCTMSGYTNILLSYKGDEFKNEKIKKCR